MKASRHVWTLPFGVLLFLFAGLLLFAQAPPQNPPAPAPAEQQPSVASPQIEPQNPQLRLAVEVELVNIVATVVDDHGSYVQGLKREDFQVLEDGREQNVSFFADDRRIPISVGVLVDISDSMKYKLAQALRTIREIALALSPEDEMFLLTFNADVEVRQRFTRNPEDILKALRGMRSSGETAAYDAIQISSREMLAARNNKKVLLMVTDGFDTKSKINLAQTEELLKHSELLAYAIGIDDDDNDPATRRRTKYHIYHEMLNKLTSVSGGKALRLLTDHDYPLQSIAHQLLEELHQQYTLSYYPASPTDSGFRKVEIKVKRPNVQVRHRAGYYITQASNGR